MDCSAINKRGERFEFLWDTSNEQVGQRLLIMTSTEEMCHFYSTIEVNNRLHIVTEMSLEVSSIHSLRCHGNYLLIPRCEMTFNEEHGYEVPLKATIKLYDSNTFEPFSEMNEQFERYWFVLTPFADDKKSAIFRVSNENPYIQEDRILTLWVEGNEWLSPPMISVCMVPSSRTNKVVLEELTTTVVAANVVDDRKKNPRVNENSLQTEN